VEQLLKPTLLQGSALAGLGILSVAAAVLLKRFVVTEPITEGENA
jgi:hypothetical protein